MPLHATSSPHGHAPITVTRIMVTVALALLPGIAACAWFFGPGVIINITFAVAVALAGEALILKLRDRPLAPFLGDGSAVITAMLLAIALPPLSPWWLTLIGVLFAIVVGKQLFGGLGYNPFNPAMLGYVMLLISFPREMTVWLPPASLSQHPLGWVETLNMIFTGTLPGGLDVDAVSMATPLDTVKTQLKLHHSVDQILHGGSVFGSFGGIGWEWVNFAFLAGGAWMIYKRIISWHIPAAMLAALTAMPLVFYGINSAAYASPLFHLFSGATMLGAFFIATDPVTASTTPRGRLIYGAGIGLLTYIIRTWGGYPDGVAFAVLLMNIAAPTIDYYTQPRVFGHKKD
jgi:H+/Na+-translocating ferredoxin:NAD+ oxidoreductase subunit D